MADNDSHRAFLRHTLATLAYRAGKALRGAPADFGTTRAAHDTRSAAEILAHIGDLLDWAIRNAQADGAWIEQAPAAWEQEVARFYDAMKRFDDVLASDAPLRCSAEKLFQGPIADALTHVGQLATLRRLAGSPVRGESYFRADIAIGRVSPDQTPPKAEFD